MALAGMLCGSGVAGAQPVPAAALAPSAQETASQRSVLELDPVLDAAMLSGSLVFAVTLEAVLSTGEIKPQTPGDSSNLLAIDRWRARSDNFYGAWSSNIGLSLVAAYAGLDTILASALDRGDPWYRYGVVYAEVAAVTLALTNLAKIAVRRPRPIAYNKAQEPATSADTNTALSFFSGHAAIAAALSTTAIYLAFKRRSSRVERWLTFAGGVLLSTFVSTMRVVEGKHFPTDVIAGMAAGASVGLLVPHLHRPSDLRGGSVSMRVLPAAEMGGASLAVGGTF